jgi:hypothetical protein
MIPIQEVISLAYIQFSLQVSPHIKVYGIDFLTDMQALPLPFQNL